MNALILRSMLRAIALDDEPVFDNPSVQSAYDQLAVAIKLSSNSTVYLDPQLEEYSVARRGQNEDWHIRLLILP